MKYDISLRITDNKITLRPLTPDDIDEYHAAIVESLSDLIPWLSYRENHTIVDTRKELEQCRGKWEADERYNFAVTDPSGGKILGYCGLNKIDRENRVANLGYWVRSSCSGSGIASAVTVLLVKWALDTCRFNRIALNIAQQNNRSLKVAEKAGAHREGVLRNLFIINNKPTNAVSFSFIPGDF